MNTNPHHDRSPRAAIAEMTPDRWAAWRTRYVLESGVELQAQAVLENAESDMRAAGQETTIRTVWMHLADRAVLEDAPEVRAAAALAGMALGLWAS